MPTIANIKKDSQFYKSFFSLIEVLKTIAASQFHSLEKKIKTFGELTAALEDFLPGINLKTLDHPFVNTKDLPMGIIVVTSDAGLMGGVNYRLMMQSSEYYLKENLGQLLIVGLQGQKFIRGTNIRAKIFPGINDEQCFRQAQELRDYIFREVLAKRLGPIKAIFPYASSIASQQILAWDILPCTHWCTARLSAEKEGSRYNQQGNNKDILLESSEADIIEYVTYLWVGQKLFEIFQFSRLAEYAARVVHLEESSQRVKEIEQKLKLKYFRIHHEIIDQQMRELFTARSLYA